MPIDLIGRTDPYRGGPYEDDEPEDDGVLPVFFFLPFSFAGVFLSSFLPPGDDRDS